jgi:oxygen-independent coproporphyrinogen-3 oxidase
MARLPEGEPAPADGALPASALRGLGERALGVYLHVPWCASRCGYCDFNTYVPGPDARGAFAAFGAAARAELRLARRVLGPAAPPVRTVFLGGGTPTLLEPAALAALLRGVDEELGLAADAEVTVEANPDTVGPGVLAALREAGATRLSLGMQSARASVLATLERAHHPERPPRAAAEARAAGFAHVSLDLIYGTPGEDDADWDASLDAALAARVDHVSAYALTLEPGTRLHARVARGELAAPDEDALARRYRRAEARLGAAGLRWYELSNWAASPAARSRHNLGYWRSADWWGVGPGAHSHIGGVRWWNVLRPRTYVARLRAGASPAAGRERLDEEARALERVLLGLRLAEGLALAELREDGRAAAAREAAAGRLEPAALARGHAVLTLQGRLVADAVVRALAG